MGNNSTVYHINPEVVIGMKNKRGRVLYCASNTNVHDINIGQIKISMIVIQLTKIPIRS